MTPPAPVCELALSISDPRQLGALDGNGALHLSEVTFLAEDESLAPLLTAFPAGCPLTHLYFGSEFCEHLLPEAVDLEMAIAIARRRGLGLVLTTPVASDALLDQLAELLPRLPLHSAVLANDWGVARMLHQHFPAVNLIAGRQLSKMLKDPRLPGEQWASLYPSGFRAGRQMRLLENFAISRIELDVPPFATPDFFALPEVMVSVHAPFAYVAKGRLCKIGSLTRPAPLKFSPGGSCHRECLGVLEIEQGAPRRSLRTMQRGSSMFYRHDTAMLDVLTTAMRQGSISRLVLAAP